MKHEPSASKNLIRFSRRQPLTEACGVALLIFGLTACAAPDGFIPVSNSGGPVTTTTVPSGVRVNLHYSSFYSLVQPQSSTFCAGDTNAYSDPYLLTPLAVPSPYPVSDSDETTTSKPDFIKNISVDLSDAAATSPVNASQACSLGVSGTVPPPSSCATFDYGALGGVPSSLAGTVLLVGGLTSENFSSIEPLTSDPRTLSLGCGPVGGATSINECSSTGYGIGVETLSGSSALTTDGEPSTLTPGLPGTAAAVNPISSWITLGSAEFPQTTGGNLGLSTKLGQLLYFGGAQPIAVLGNDVAGSDTADAWTFDLKTQVWTKQATSTVIPKSVIEMIDENVAGSDIFQRTIGGRAIFGLISSMGFALRSMSTYNAVSGGLVRTSGSATLQNAANQDTVERIVAIGGLVETGVSVQSLKFNPSFGPEFVDLYDDGGGTTTGVLQYIESHHTQLLSNSTAETQLWPDPDSLAITNFGAAPARVFDSVTGEVAAGFAAVAGGFPNLFTNNRVPTGVTSPSPSPAGLLYNPRTTNGDLNANPRTSMGQMIALPNDLNGTDQYPARWRVLDPPVSAVPDTVTNREVPFFGGASLIPGLDLRRNDVVFFGGTTCRDYLGDAATYNPACSFANVGRYYRLYDDGTTTPLPINHAAGNYSTIDNILFTYHGSMPYLSPPRNAGMAAARGKDTNGGTIVVAFGGMDQQAANDSTGRVFIMYNTSALPATTPQWRMAASTLPRPVGLANASMVYSHVTGKFYLFGGASTTAGLTSEDDTWELSMQGDCTSVVGCIPRWRQLKTVAEGGGLTCSPVCPQARRSHRMVETNYAYRVGASLNVDPVTQELDCSNADVPCSLGIFMFGGTPDGTTLLNDRWMFDPTANNGVGHWQRVDDPAPRHFGAMALVEYEAAGTGKIYKRAVVFGGETGLQNPKATRAGNFFVPPTLGDTWIYDLEDRKWTRPRLLGKGYFDSSEFPSDEFELRQAYAIQNGGVPAPDFAELSALSPPPMAGMMMVTRTYPTATASATTPVQPLKVPEVFMFGGRGADGTYQPMTRVYKFCIGSTGERQGTLALDDAQCDHFDLNDNPNSPSPVAEPVGRWLLKSPDVDGSATPAALISQSYLGAAAYDPSRDKIYAVGGLTSTTAVTNSAGRAAMGFGIGSVDVLEYTPPSRQMTTATAPEKQGAWITVPECTTSAGAAALPVARYGHSLVYDASRAQLIMMGGFALDGTPLTTTITDPLNSVLQYEIPQVWTAKWIAPGTPVATTLSSGVTLTAVSPVTGCFYWQTKSIFGNRFTDPSTTPPLSGLSHFGAVILPPEGYQTGYYTMMDQFCGKANPLSTDPEVGRLNAGGLYIDIDRDELGASENLLLNLTWIPLGQGNQRPDGSKVDAKEGAVLEVHLVNTSQTETQLKSQPQPRYIEYADTGQDYPAIVQTLSVLSTPTGEARQDQLLLPISVNSSIDRIWIRRKSGSAILIDATLIRMGN